MTLSDILHALQEIPSKPPLLVCAVLVLLCLAALLVLLVAMAISRKRPEDEGVNSR
jgi:hypothetical protein